MRLQDPLRKTRKIYHLVLLSRVIVVVVFFFLSDKLWYCRLSPNHKVLHYGDVEEETEMPSIEALQEKSKCT